MNLRKLTKHEMCMALANAGTGQWAGDEFTSEYENQYENWLTAYVFVKMLGPNEALYLVVQYDDEGPNPYEGECCCYAHVKQVGDKVTLAWAEWAPAM